MAWTPTSTAIIGNLTVAAADPINIWASQSVTSSGEWVFMSIATDNLTTTDVESNDHVGVSSASGVVGGSWTKVGEFTNGQTAAKAGATVSLWYCQTDDTTIGSTTLDLSAGVDKVAWSGFGMTLNAGSTVQLAQAINPAATDAADPVNINMSPTLPSAISRLWVRAIALESNTSNAVTPDGSWTAFGGGDTASTTGGGSAANMASGGTYLITTATIGGSNPTWAAGDNANILCAFNEVLAAAMPVNRTRQSNYPQLLVH